MNRKIKIALFIFLVLFMIGATSGRQKATEPTPTAIPTASPTKTPETTDTTVVIYEAYIKGCTNGGVTWAYCDCTFDYLHERMTDAEMLEMSVAMNANGDIPDVLVNAAASCKNEL
jgi:hypothetical protein